MTHIHVCVCVCVCVCVHVCAGLCMLHRFVTCAMVVVPCCTRGGGGGGGGWVGVVCSGVCGAVRVCVCGWRQRVGT
ncbi:hypothetical protein ABG752_01330, partial [Streptococcus iniae]